MRRLRIVFLSGLFLLTSCSSLPTDPDATTASSTDISMLEETRAAPSMTTRASATPEPTATVTLTPTATADPEDLDDVLGCYEVAAELMVDANTAVWLGQKHWGSNPTEDGLQEIYQFLASRSERHDRLANGEETRAMNPVCADAYRTFLSTSTSIQFVNYGSGIGTTIGSLVETDPIERWAGHLRYLLIHDFSLSAEDVDAMVTPLWEDAQRLWGTPRLRLTLDPQPVSTTPAPQTGTILHSPGSGTAFYLREGPDYTYPAFAVVTDDGSFQIEDQYGRCAWLNVTVGDLSGWIANPDGIVLSEDACNLPCGTFRPFTGTVFRDGRLLVTGFQEGPGELIVENHGHDDAIAVLTYADGEAYLSFYIRSGDSYTLREIPDGVYTLFITTGWEWDPDSGLFSLRPEYFQFEAPLDFDASGIRWSVALESSEAGNAPTEDISPDAFPQ